MAGALLTDLYELNMAASYLRRNMEGQATFSLFVRRLPPGRAFLVAAGLDSCLRWLEDLRFETEDLAYLSGVGFSERDLDSFSRLRFTGDAWAVPEGRIVFAGEPLLEVTAPIAEGQIAETVLLNQITFQTAIASKAARCRIAAGEDVDLVEFGFRRSQGIDAGIAVARLSALVGFVATSNVESSRLYGLRPAGTMAHSYVEAFASEADAFRAFARDHPGATTFLVDTYDTLRGVATAIEVIRQLHLESAAAVRLDSGDLGSLARDTRRMLDDSGLSGVRIFLSGGLDEYDIDRLRRRGAPFDAVGVGTKLSVSADAPYLDSAYKLVDYGGRPVLKLSEGKATLPGAKQVFRSEGLHDILGLRHEEVPPGCESLLQHVMARGGRVGTAPSLEESRQRFENDLASLPDALRDLHARSAPQPELSTALSTLNEQATATATRADTS
jgi:nicotinate phosphoribosyltransferase